MVADQPPVWRLCVGDDPNTHGAIGSDSTKIPQLRCRITLPPHSSTSRQASVPQPIFLITAMPGQRIYLDFNATTPIASEVATAISQALTDPFGNPSSEHWAGRPAREAVEKARAQVAALLRCSSDEVVFTSGGSESNNHALKGAFFAQGGRGSHICQGRSKTRPVRRSKSRPGEQAGESGFVGEEGVWSEGLRRLQGGAFRPERKTSSSPRRVRRMGGGRGLRPAVGGIRSSSVSLVCACSASAGNSRRSSPGYGRGG